MKALRVVDMDTARILWTKHSSEIDLRPLSRTGAKKSCATYTRACQFLNESSNAKTISYDDFEVIKKLGDGNFTQVFQVCHKRFP